MNKFQALRVWRWEQDATPVTFATDCALLLYTEGRGVVCFNGKRHTLTHKHILYVQPETQLRLEPAECDSHPIIGLFFQSYVLQETTVDSLVYRLDYSKLPYNGYVIRPLAARISALVLRLARLQQPESASDYHFDHGIDELVGLILSQMDKQLANRSSSEQAVVSIMQGILEHCEQDWNRDQAAREARFNTSHFSRAFKQYSGYSFSGFLSKVRLNHARILLLTTDLTLDMIASRTGFQNGLYFSRRFKRDSGVPPSTYRSLLQGTQTRIATMHHAGDLLALGVQPVAASLAPWHTSPLLHDRLIQGGTVVSNGLEDVALLTSVQPDLILIPDYLLLQNANRLQQFERIAPVLCLPSYRYPPLERLRLVADILGRRQEAEQWIIRYQRKADIWRDRLTDYIQPGETVALYELRGNDTVILWSLQLRGASNLFEAMRFQPPAAVAQEVLAAGQSLTIPIARLGEYAADHMFVIVGESADGPVQFLARIGSDPVWSSLEAFRQSRIYYLALTDFWSDDGMALAEQLPLLFQAVEKAHGMASPGPAT
ncbi:hypothetical protein PA598K_05314 [Paenibacillus sp. 598K]|uniref:helix-turn-helix domain-containing protein n=1 Tax=Paenibacillus sp. 598K TaxID=1117987 RepID=UPI000FFAA688|nr:helix-turn-helix domain-containing protein [Paenibacillus sp. 598K]GBF76822.1 hypothetical protein PA598K_05314 [Paenibacillus sp. 598K]